MTTAPSSRPEPPRPPLGRLVELALVVPVEVSGRLIEAVPGVIDKVPPAADRVRRELVLARFLGKLAVDQGLRELRSRVTPNDDVESPPTKAPSPADVASAASADDDAVEPGDAAPEADALALADYDHLSSAQVVSKLAGLEVNELDAIEAYERSGRHRRTILGKIAQLRSVDGQQ